MIKSWPLLQSIVWPKENIGEVIGTLVGYEHDFLILLKKDNKFRLQYLADMDENNACLRYIVVEIDKMRLRGLLTSCYPLNDCISNRPIAIMDYNYNADEYIFYQSDGVAIPLECHPEQNLVLPAIHERFIQLAMGFVPSNCCIIVGGEAVSNNSISFADYSKLLSSIQRASNECLGTENLKNISYNPNLRVEAQQAASFAIQIIAEDIQAADLLGSKINEFSELFTNGSKEAIYDVLDKMPTSLAKALFSLYGLTMSGGLEILYKLGKHYCYLDGSRSHLIRSNINDARYVRNEEVVAHGYLVGANLKTNYFYFEEIDNGSRYRGKLSEEFSALNGKLTIDEETIWRATFIATTEFNFAKISQKYLLTKLEEPR